MDQFSFFNALKFGALSILFSGVVLVPGVEISAQKTKTETPKKSGKNYDKTVLATVGKEKITYGELEKAYRTMNRKETMNLYEVPRQEVEDFLNIYIRYRLKVQDAKDKGFETDPAVMADINQNRKLLAESFLFDKKLTEPSVERLLKRRDRELSIAIIHFAIPQVGDADTLKAFQRANRALNAIKKGADFAQLARDSSDDSQTGPNGGELPSYITGGVILRPVEDAAYAISKPGEVYPDVVKTRFGYFLVKLLKSEPRRLVQSSHILITQKEGDSLAAGRTADSLLALLKKGADFKKLARENSDDKTSAMRGGTVGGWYSRSQGFEDTQGQRLVSEYENAMFSLKPGQYSGVIFTDYGAHIITVDSVKTVSADEERDEVKKMYRRVYFEEEKQQMIDSIKRAEGFRFNENVFNKLLSSVDTVKTTFDTTWRKQVPSELYPQVVYYTSQGNFTVNALLDSLTRRPDFRGYTISRSGISRAIEKIVEPMVLSRATSRLENDYPEFADRMREFRDGILLFKAEDQQVWSKLKFDSTLARHYYDTTRSRYNTETKYNISEIYVLTDSMATSLKRQLDNGADFAALAGQYTMREGYRERQGHLGTLAARENKLAAMADAQKLSDGAIVGPIAIEKGFALVRVNKVEPSRQKTFEEAIPELAPAFQDQLQKQLTEEWLNGVRERHPVKVETATLGTIFTRDPKNG
jgi:peptidyl-prolyl cis-trans isomerase SurA